MTQKPLAPHDKRRASPAELQEMEKRFRQRQLIEDTKRKEENEKLKPLINLVSIFILFVLPILLLCLIGTISAKVGITGSGGEGYDKCIDNRGSYDC